MEQQKQKQAAARSTRQLEEISYRLSHEIIEMTTKAGSGHPSSSLSIIDIMTVLYFGGLMRYDPTRPDWPDRDRFILSKGHASPGLYVALAEAGYFDKSLLGTLRQFGSPLEGHPVKQRLAGVEASTGSLGQGLSIGLGQLLAGRIDQRDYHVYVIIGDGESDEGQVWEAAMAAAKYKADHLTAILDFNRYQQTGPMEQVMPSMQPVGEKWRAFDWEVFEVDGHDIDKVQQTLQEARAVQGKPQMVIAHTDKGKNLSPFVKDTLTRKHGATLSEEESQIALNELEIQYQTRMSKESGMSVTKGG